MLSFLWQDFGFVLLELGAFVIILRDLSPKSWGPLDSYWLFVGAPVSVLLSLTLKLWLYAALWLLYGVMRSIQLHRYRTAHTATESA